MAFAIVGETIRAGGKSFGPLGSHGEAVRATQEAVRRAQRKAKAKGLPQSSTGGLAIDELEQILLRWPLSFGTIVRVKEGVPDGDVITLVRPFYEDLVAKLLRDPDLVHKINSRKWEELIAASYVKAGFDEVILTPPSGDRGVDVIAIKKGFGSVRFVDQVKAYSPGHLVTAREVSDLLGVLLRDQNATKAILTTTSYFAPGIQKDRDVQRLIPFRLELIDKDSLLKRLAATLC